MLRTQYRMSPAICKLVGDFAYGGRLTTAAGRGRCPGGSAPGGLVGARPLALIDTEPRWRRYSTETADERALEGALSAPTRGTDSSSGACFMTFLLPGRRPVLAPRLRF